MMCDENKITLNDELTSLEEIQKTKDELKKNEKLVEVSPGNFHILEKMNG